MFVCMQVAAQRRYIEQEVRRSALAEQAQLADQDARRALQIQQKHEAELALRERLLKEEQKAFEARREQMLREQEEAQRRAALAKKEAEEAEAEARRRSALARKQAEEAEERRKQQEDVARREAEARRKRYEDAARQDEEAKRKREEAAEAARLEELARQRAAEAARKAEQEAKRKAEEDARKMEKMKNEYDLWKDRAADAARNMADLKKKMLECGSGTGKEGQAGGQPAPGKEGECPGEWWTDPRCKSYHPTSALKEYVKKVGCASIFTRNDENWLPIHYAAQDAEEDLVYEMLRMAPSLAEEPSGKRAHAPEGWCALHFACNLLERAGTDACKPRMRMMRVILQSGANPNVRMPNGNTPFMKASSLGWYDGARNLVR